ncbi:retrovirus-related pol polyprotein from transposon TNT 1-94, partial [Tanacetum coccineum]
QTSGNANPFAYMAQATHLTSLPSHYVSPPPQYAPTPQQAPPSTNNAMLATRNQIVNLLRKHAATGSQGKVVTCYNCGGQGHVAMECKEKKRVKDSRWFKDKALLMEAKERGAILDAKAEAFLDAYDSDVDEEPHAAAAFMANLMQTGQSTARAPVMILAFI